jgi:hypothetical protein
MNTKKGNFYLRNRKSLPQRPVAKPFLPLNVSVPSYSYLDRFKGMSWADICDEVDEEERIAKEISIKAKAEERLRLYARGNYELEEGELLE